MLRRNNAVYSVLTEEKSKEKGQGDYMTPSVRYSRLLQDESEFSDMQFQAPPPKVPWRAIGLAFMLFFMGTCLIVVGAMLFSGFIDAKYGDRTWPVLILGSILFIPGAYHVRLAYYAFKEEPGYSFDEIPDFD